MVKNLPDAGSIPDLGRFTGEGNGYPLQYSCLKNCVQRSLAGCSPWGCKELDMTEWETWVWSLGRSPGEGKGYLLQYSGLENSTDYVVHGVAKNPIQLSNFK